MAETPRMRRLGFEPDDRPHSPWALPRLLLDALALVWRAAPRLVVVLVALQLVTAAGFGVTLLVVRAVVAQLLTAQQTHIGLTAVLPELGLMTVVLLLITFASTFGNSIRMVLTEQVSETAFRPVVDVATAVDLEAYDSSQFHDRMQRALNAAGRPFMMTQALLQLGGSLATVVGLVAVLLLLQPLLLPSLLLTLVPLLLAASAFSRDFRTFSMKFSEHERRRQYVRGLLTGGTSAKEVRAYGLAAHLQEMAARMFERRMAELWNMVGRGSARSLVGSAASALAIAVTIGVMAWFVLDRGMSVATATAAAIAIVGLAPQVASLAFSVGQLYESALFLEDLGAFRAELPAILEARPSAPAPERFGTLRLEDVRFTYPGSERPALNGVSLTIRRGEVVALVGENGSGKTTLAKILSGLYRPHGGRVCWDGIDVSGVDAEE
ncbi:MAG TPA: ABC transporter ATP-binding protein/permease, partial [Candidatus Eisenbacteria bacterium]|nr:ABC transporter ATP-binding protein/permease [Candidatus Eisenbacteria bacterium]